MLSVCKHAIGSLTLAVALAVVPVAGSDAGTSSASLSVGVTVLSNCKVTAAALTFPNYVSGQASAGTTSSNLSYTGCQNELVKFELSDEANAQSGSRGMKNSGGAVLDYQLYRNATYTTVIGSGTNAVSFTAPATGSGTVTIYGRIPASQVLASGSYSDAVAVTLTF